MVLAGNASSFWAAVEDCLVEFHELERDTAAEKVTGLWRRIPKAEGAGGEEPSFDDMIYHAEPWYIACNLADKELPLARYRLAYKTLLHRNDLA
jgi:hypothetical protein